MMVTLRRPLAYAALLLSFVQMQAPREVRAAEDEQEVLKKRVLREFPPALARLEALYSQVRVSARLTVENRSRNAASASPTRPNGVQPAAPAPDLTLESTWSYEWRVAVNGHLQKIDSTRIFNKYYDEGTGSLLDLQTSPRNPARSVVCRVKSHSFRLRWEKDVPLVAFFGGADDKDSNSVLTRSIDELLNAPCGVFAGGLHMLKIMSYPSFSVRKVVKTPGRSGDNLLIEFECDPRDNPDTSQMTVRTKTAQGKTVKFASKIKRWIETSPNENWVVLGLGQDRSRGLRDLATEIVYGDVRSGVPILRQVTVRSPVIGSTRVLEVKNIEFGPVPEREFTLAAYGLPELNPSSQARRDNHLAIVLFGAALFALSIATALKYYASRSRTQ